MSNSLTARQIHSAARRSLYKSAPCRRDARQLRLVRPSDPRSRGGGGLLPAGRRLDHAAVPRQRRGLHDVRRRRGSDGRDDEARGGRRAAAVDGQRLRRRRRSNGGARRRSSAAASSRPPADYPGVGRLAVLADPQGAPLNVLQPSQPIPAPRRTKPGAFTWRELDDLRPRGRVRLLQPAVRVEEATRGRPGGDGQVPRLRPGRAASWAECSASQGGAAVASAASHLDLLHTGGRSRLRRGARAGWRRNVGERPDGGAGRRARSPSSPIRRARSSRCTNNGAAMRSLRHVRPPGRDRSRRGGWRRSRSRAARSQTPGELVAWMGAIQAQDLAAAKLGGRIAARRARRRRGVGQRSNRPRARRRQRHPHARHALDLAAGRAGRSRTGCCRS